MTSWHPGETKEQASERYAWHQAYEQLVKAENVVHTPSGCWLWKASFVDRLPIIDVCERRFDAVQVAWEAWYGCPPGKALVPRCGISQCVNPRHYFQEGEEFTSLHRAYIKGNLTPRNALKLAREFGTTPAAIRKIAAENL